MNGVIISGKGVKHANEGAGTTQPKSGFPWNTIPKAK